MQYLISDGIEHWQLVFAKRIPYCHHTTLSLRLHGQLIRHPYAIGRIGRRSRWWEGLPSWEPDMKVTLHAAQAVRIAPACLPYLLCICSWHTLCTKQRFPRLLSPPDLRGILWCTCTASSLFSIPLQWLQSPPWSCHKRCFVPLL